MGIHIQPNEIEIPEKDPFENDLLDRRQSAQVLTRLVGAIEGPCVLAVDAAWGAGKTTFLKIWSQYLRNQGFPVVEFNAWETDYSGNPFVALSSELMMGLGKYQIPALDKKIDVAKKFSKELLQLAVPHAIQLALNSVPGGQAVSEPLTLFVKDRLDTHQEVQNSIEEFKKALREMAEELAKQENHSLIVVIDELDRCRPTYAVELLEIAKHLFSVDKIIFVLAVNRPQLAHSIQALYGHGFDGEGYLGRFFDLDFRLSEPKRDNFIDALLGQNLTHSHILGDVKKMLRVFFGAHDLSLRQVAQTIHRLRLVLATIRDDRKPYIFIVVALLILRTVDTKLYRRFCQGDATDLEVSETLSAMIKERSSQVDEARFDLDTTLILLDIGISNRSTNRGLSESPLYKKYKRILDESSSTEPGYMYANDVVALVTKWHGEYKGRYGFYHSFELIELFSADLIDST